MTGYTDAQIAEVCHEANRALQRINGDPHADPEWADVPWRASAVADVHTARAGTTPQEMHAAWCARKRAQGWTWGPVRDEQARTHPCLVDDYQLVPWPERAKDALYLAIIGALSGEAS
jgi:hypothetical protein